MLGLLQAMHETQNTNICTTVMANESMCEIAECVKCQMPSAHLLIDPEDNGLEKMRQFFEVWCMQRKSKLCNATA